MRIQQISLRNFRGFPKRDLSLSEGFNLLIGENGSGKTSVLDALALVLAPLVAGLTRTADLMLSRDDIRLLSFQKGDSVHVEEQLPLELICQARLMDGEISWTRGLSGEEAATELLEESVNEAGEETEAQRDSASEDRAPKETSYRDMRDLGSVLERLRRQVQEGANVVLPLVAYYRAKRLWQVNPREAELPTLEPQSRLDAYSGCLRLGTDQKHFVRWLKTFELASLQQRRRLEPLEAVSGTLKRCLPEKGWSRLYYNVQRNDVIAYRESDGRAMPYRMLSDGWRSMMALVADLAYRAVALNPHLGASAPAETPGVVMIDELDLHLHPSWQRRVVEDLRLAFPLVQFVCTSHSPFIVQSLRPGELIDLEDRALLELAQETIEDITEHVMGVSIPQRSRRHQELLETAREYYQVLDRVDQPMSDSERTELEQRLDDLTAPFSDNPAAQALLELRRLAKTEGGSEK